MNGFLLMIPLLIVRFGLLGLIDKTARQRASYFAPVQGFEEVASFVYQLSSVLMIIDSFFITGKTNGTLFYSGIVVYLLGLIILIITTFNFAKPSSSGMNTHGLYRFSRNPMYVGYFIYFLGCALLTQSWLLLILIIIFQVSSHWIIISEERWCISKFKQEYIDYMSKVRRYV